MPSEIHKLSLLHVRARGVLVIGSLCWARAVFVPEQIMQVSPRIGLLWPTLYRVWLGYA
jgi:hypothetical protein